ncbi:MAG: DMT family protein [Phycisphaerales bacterium]
MSRLLPVLLLLGSNLFMTYAWYGHLKDFKSKPLLVVILLSWAVAFFEYCLQVPANRLGHQVFTLAQLKVMQEVITMVVFAVFCTAYMKEKLTLDFLWGGFVPCRHDVFHVPGACAVAAMGDHHARCGPAKGCHRSHRLKP